MSRNIDDISLIRRYLNGELDARAMYELERRAEDDPMLMDMMRGMESAAPDRHDQNLFDIKQLILERVEEKRDRKVIGWPVWAAAACFILLAGFVGWFLSQDPKQGYVALNKTTPLSGKQTIVKPAPADARDKISWPASPESTADTIASSSALAALSPQKHQAYNPEAKIEKNELAEPPQLAKEVAIGDVEIAGNYNRQNLAAAAPQLKRVGVEPVKSDQVLAANPTAKAKTSVKADTVELGRALAGRMPGVQVRGISPLTDNHSTMVTVRGRVIDQEAKLPLPGVSITTADRKYGAQTDAEGRFTITIPASAGTLELSYIGYEKKLITTQKDEALAIAMEPSSKSLNEVVVIGYGTQSKRDVTGAVSYIGASALERFRDYVKRQAKSPDGKPYKVVVRFTVMPDDQLCDFVIVRSQNESLNERAIQIIKDGAKGVYTPKKHPRRVTLRIRFKK